MSSQFSTKVTKIRCVNGMEVDWLSRRWRRVLARNRAGRSVLKFVKRSYNKRVRQNGKTRIRNQLNAE